MFYFHKKRFIKSIGEMKLTITEILPVHFEIDLEFPREVVIWCSDDCLNL